MANKTSFRLQLLALILLLVLTGSVLVSAQETTTDDPGAETADEEQVDEEEGAKLLDQIRRQLNTQSDALGEVSEDVSVIEQHLHDASEKITTLEEQLEILANEIDYSERKIALLDKEIERLNKAIDKKKAEIEEKQKDLAELEDLAAEFMRFLYVQNVNIGSFDSSFSQTIKLLFAEEFANDQLTDLYFLELVEVTQRNLFEELDRLKLELQEQEIDLKKEKTGLTVLQREAVRVRNVKVIQQDAQVALLEETRGKEEIYRSLLKQAQEDRVRIRRQIRDLGVSYEQLAEQLNKVGSGFATNKVGAELGDGKLGWPIKPSRGISAFFRDQSYKAALGVEHDAIDIRAVMQTPVLAAEDGIVSKIKGGDDISYHYIIIAHRGGILTLYGHMYDIFVTEGEVIRRGQTIGLSGGLPGTRGAGYLTTGPHLHFEVFNNGRNVDPMLYMDLSQIDAKYLPDAYLIRRR